jgi:hypothetical protein
VTKAMTANATAPVIVMDFNMTISSLCYGGA